MSKINNREKGNIGEGIACKFLISKGFKVTDRNYLKKYGELDIVAMKDGTVHFFEVKSVAKEFAGDFYTNHPEDNVYGLKVKRLRRVIQAYLEDKSIGLDAVFHFHILAVFMDMKSRKGRVNWIKDVIL